MYLKTEKTKTILISCIVALAIGFCLCGTASAAFAGGDGSPEDPFQIENVNQLKEVSENLDAGFRLTKDIQITDSEWHPIGTSWEPFTGTFDGQGHSITFTKATTFIDAEDPGSTENYGLFGTIRKGDDVTEIIDGEEVVTKEAIDPFVRDLKIIMNGDFLVMGGPFGSLVGKTEYALIENCSVKGNYVIRAAENADEDFIRKVGGLVGEARYSEIKYCSATPDIKVGSERGGLISYAWDSTVSVSFATGDIYSDSYDTYGSLLGGLIGSVNSSCIIENCYSSGNISGAGEDIVGGLIGKPDTSTIRNCYSSGFISKSKFVGGLGFPDRYVNKSFPQLCTFENSYYDIENLFFGEDLYEYYHTDVLVIPELEDEELGRTTEEMKSFMTFADSGWDISDNPEGNTIWYINEGVTYPLFEYKDKEDRDDDKNSTGGNGGGSGTGSATVVENNEPQKDITEMKPPGTYVPAAAGNEAGSAAGSATGGATVQGGAQNTEADGPKDGNAGNAWAIFIPLFVVICICVLYFGYKHSKR
ncbi:GLUG motif-containing protein [Methanimicrococcus blatticola]|uniref:GLUG domain-containing protein n=1 Tax=Methanimicrococcus blatticola TaxID=91560 RepID=A0A484F5B1_9EURY|nr:GLUG motif-containing protein [Methanimicrococcus blatticola]MBZ3936397.1 hypothetical protein [Methanimicrococcus blatticola]MCC2509559.1 hypothetical protein [Methanimicrococcus blatticola]TDQ67610.1 hypothetical protein C7391_1584 [Methanimicrococcus blatticola]